MCNKFVKKKESIIKNWNNIKLYIFMGGVIVLIIGVIYIVVAKVAVKLNTWQFDDAVLAAIISGIFGCITLIGTVIAICITWITNKNKNLIEVVTKNRADWVKEIKELFSEFFIEYDKEEKKMYLLFKNDSKLNDIKNKISLRLNPNGDIDLKILNKINKLIEKRDESLRKELENEIKLYLKCEWERIKFETKEGLKKYNFENEFEKIKADNENKTDNKIKNG